MSKKILMVFIIILFVLSFCVKKKQGNQVQKKGYQIQKTVVTFVLGEASIKSILKNDWEQIKVGRLLGLNDTIKVGKKGRVVVQTQTGSVLTFKDLTEVKVSTIINPKTNDEETFINMSEGKAIIKPRSLRGKSNFKVSTPAVVAGVRGTIFSVEHRGSKSRVAVKEGKVSVKPKLESIKIQEKIASIEVKTGEKTELDTTKVKEFEAKLKKQPESADISPVSEVIEVKSLNEDEKNIIEEEANNLRVLNIKFSDEGEIISTVGTEVGDSSKLRPLTLSCRNCDIYVGGVLVGENYYSGLYPQNTSLEIELRKRGTTIIKKTIMITHEGFNFEYKQEGVIEEDSSVKYKLLSKNIKSKSNDMKIVNKGLCFINRSSIKLYPNLSSAAQKISVHPNVKPYVSSSRIFSINSAGNLEVYNFTGKLLGKANLTNIIFKTSVAFYGGEAYAGNAVGQIVGINSKGNALSFNKVTGSIAHLAVNEKYVVAAVPSFGIFVFDKKTKKMVSKFRVGFQISKKIGIIGNILIVPQSNRKITIRDIKGRILNNISAVEGDIDVISSKNFAIRYNKLTLVYGVDGKQIKEVKSNKVFFYKGLMFYAEDNRILLNDFESERNISELPGDIQTLSVKDKEVYVYLKDGNLYQFSF